MIPEKKITGTKLQIAICRKRPHIELGLIRKTLKQEYMTIAQLCGFTGKSPNVINGLCIPRINGHITLNRVNPFPSVDEEGNIKSGPIFIELNEDCKRFILESNI